MVKFEWTDQLNVGIEVIDQQHRRITEYINQLDKVASGGHRRTEIGYLINDLVDYTISHFGFEESLLEEAGYPFLKAHKKVHELFAKRVVDFKDRFDRGEDISRDLSSLLVIWLLNHIKHDDADYAKSVKEYLDQQQGVPAKKKGFLARLFG